MGFVCLLAASTAFAADLTIKGRLAIPESANCLYQNDIQTISWEQCHQFKRRFDPQTGAAITVDQEVTNSLRPLPVRIIISFYVTNQQTPPQGLSPCSTSVVQSDLDGFFTATLPACGAAGSPLLVEVISLLSYDVYPTNSTTKTGTIRALWPKPKADSVYNPSFANPALNAYGDMTLTFGNTEPYSYPKYRLLYPQSQGSPAPGSTTDLGIVNLLTGNIPSSALGYQDYLLNKWAGLIVLHSKLQAEYESYAQSQNDPNKNLYPLMFITDGQKQCTACYSMYLNSSYASFAASGMVMMVEPMADLVWSREGMVSPLAHEFAHTVHQTIAPNSANVPNDPCFGSGMLEPDGTPICGIHFEQQVQEMNIAFTEGIATGLGQYFVNQCNGARDFNQQVSYLRLDTYNMTIFSGDTQCGTWNLCSYPHFKWHMQERGIGENTNPWNYRLQALQDRGTSGLGRVLSNNESRWAMFACDLLDTRTSLEQLGDYEQWMTGMQYFADYVADIGNILNGIIPQSFSLRSYTRNPTAENLRISLPRMLEALNTFHNPAETFPGSMTDPTYPAKRLSNRSAVAPQTFGLFVAQKGWIDSAGLDNLLQSNFMETASSSCGNGLAESPEECDDGNTSSGDGCTQICTSECGDGVVQPGEMCDDGNRTPGDGCNAWCYPEPAVCGNGRTETGEQCDDGNGVNGDGCSTWCLIETFPVCGNGVREGAEQCDDGNTNSGDGCSAACYPEP